MSVTMLLTAGLALGINFLMPRGPIEQLLGVGIAATAAAQFSPEVGNAVQQYVTTAIPFNLEVERVYPLDDYNEHPGHFVRVRWIPASGE
jgi:hypothetical protein